jgi:hypothetical protein
MRKRVPSSDRSCFASDCNTLVRRSNRSHANTVASRPTGSLCVSPPGRCCREPGSAPFGCTRLRTEAIVLPGDPQPDSPRRTCAMGARGSPHQPSPEWVARFRSSAGGRARRRIRLTGHTAEGELHAGHVAASLLTLFDSPRMDLGWFRGCRQEVHVGTGTQSRTRPDDDPGLSKPPPWSRVHHRLFELVAAQLPATRA